MAKILAIVLLGDPQNFKNFAQNGRNIRRVWVKFASFSGGLLDPIYCLKKFGVCRPFFVPRQQISIQHPKFCSKLLIFAVEAVSAIFGTFQVHVSHKVQIV